MGISKRFFVRLAAEFKEARPSSPADETAFAVWMHMVTITANTLQLANISFDRARFYEASGMPENVVAVAAQRGS
jgi:hypothetical protein